MAKTIEIPDNMNGRQVDWLRKLLVDASNDALGMARNNHIFALGEETQAGAEIMERHADELREYSKILSDIAANL